MYGSICYKNVNIKILRSFFNTWLAVISSDPAALFFPWPEGRVFLCSIAPDNPFITIYVNVLAYRDISRNKMDL